MRDLSVRDILDLAKSAPEDPRSQLTKIYEWRYDHAMTGAKAFAGLGASLLVAFVIAAIQKRIDVDWKVSTAGFGGSALLIGVSIIQYIRVRSVARQYLTAQRILARAQEITPFLHLYDRERSKQ